MKRFHVHVGVDNLGKNIAFYSSIFGQAPTVVKDDYAKWMLDDPRINFAISSRGLPKGVDHLGIQTDSAEELTTLRAQTAKADLATLDEGVTNCCYAKSDKYWTADPQGIAWETFHTLGDIPTFGASAKKVPEAAKTTCCGPATTSAPLPATRKSACC